MEIIPIGIIHTPYKAKETCPIQAACAPECEGSLEVFEAYAEGLRDIESFSHLYVLYLFDRAGEMKMIRPTFLDDEPHGIYASRHPCRPNGIGLSVVRLLRREDRRLIIENPDMLDQTPLIDIKPYIPRFDQVSSASNGWVDGKALRPKPAGRE